jgi:hypothetical protein
MKLLTESRARSLIESHFAKRISPADERRMRSHLALCEACGRVYNAHLLFESITAGSTAAGSALARERLAAGLGFRAGSQRAIGTWVGALACAAAALIALRVGSAKHDAEFAVRGSAERQAPRVLVYALSPTRELRPNDQIEASDKLAFAYSNPSGFRNLLVFGVDEHRHVYWYYPAWRNLGEHPRALAIESETAGRELPEAIRHDLDGQTLALHAVFLDEDMPVERIETLVAGASSPGEALPLPGARQQLIPLTVERQP